MYKYLLLLLVTAANVKGLAQKKDSTFPIIPIEIGLLAASQVGLSVFWYDDFERFSFRNDGKQWLQMDKAGHFMSAYQVAKANEGLCLISGLEAKKAKRWSLISTSVFYTGIELLDGFSVGYGFSFGDFVANELGIALIALPQSWQSRFSLRYSYRPTPFAPQRPELLGHGGIESAFKDYNGQTYWLSLWQKKRDKWYHYIGLSFGYGATGMLGGSENPRTNEAGEQLPFYQRQREYNLALDFDLQGLAIGKPKLQKFLRLVDFIKIPLQG